MKIAITSQGNTLDSTVDPRFGRAKWFIIYDTETGEHATVDNIQNINAAQGAGIQAAETISRHDAHCLITGHCGPNAYRTLSAAGIQVITGGTGTVQNVIDDFKSGKLKEASKPDVEGHWV
jgi:predicted Fe-Mo cluster-binding NifX family protein